MSPDADFDLDAELPPHAPTLISDLGSHTLFVAMAGGDQYLYDVARVAVLASSPTMTTVGHRQSVLADCVDNPEMARAVYAIAESAVTVDRSMSFGLFYRSPESVLNGSVKHLAVLTQHLGQLRRELEEQSGGFAPRASCGSPQQPPTNSVTSTSTRCEDIFASSVSAMDRSQAHNWAP